MFSLAGSGGSHDVSTLLELLRVIRDPKKVTEALEKLQEMHTKNEAQLSEMRKLNSESVRRRTEAEELMTKARKAMDEQDARAKAFDQQSAGLKSAQENIADWRAKLASQETGFVRKMNAAEDRERAVSEREHAIAAREERLQQAQAEAKAKVAEYQAKLDNLRGLVA